MSDAQQWFYSLPKLTRYWFAGTVVLSLLGRFGILNPYYLILNYDLIFNHFQIWRPLTAVLFYPISPQTGFHFLINLYFLVNYSKLIEEGEYGPRPADYATMLLINWGFSVLAGLFMNMLVLMDPMVLSVLYLWCNLNKDQIVSFWFGTKFPAWYLPWVLFGFNFILGGGGISELMGIVIGHLYYFMKYQYPQQYGGAPLISTPGFLDQYFPARQGGGFGVPPQVGAARGGGAAAGGGGGGGHRWGQGRNLND